MKTNPCKNEWTLYVPNNPNTHPESGERVLVYTEGHTDVVAFKAGSGFFLYNEGTYFTFVNEPKSPLFWQHLPKPPVES